MVSVVVSVFNAEKFLDRCVVSLVNQSYANLEVILVDDGSTDNSRSICELYQKQYPDKIQCVCQKNCGASKARMHGVLKCRGEYIMFVDSDDEVMPDYVKRFLDNVDSHANIVASGDRNQELTSKDFAEYLILTTKYWGMVRKLYHKSVFKDVEYIFDIPRDIIIGEDIIANIRILQNVNIVKMISYDGYISNVNAESLTHTRMWSADYEKRLVRIITASLKNMASDLSMALWRHEMNAYCKVSVYGDDSFDKLAEWRRELKMKKPADVNIPLAEQLFLLFGKKSLRVVKKAFIAWKNINNRSDILSEITK